MPIWLLSGAFFPLESAAAPLGWVMRLDPLTYGLAALRRCLVADTAGVPALLPSLVVTLLFAAASLAAAVATARRSAYLGRATPP
jgi:ABC-2 type transport system permease protein